MNSHLSTVPCPLKDSGLCSGYGCPYDHAERVPCTPNYTESPKRVSSNSRKRATDEYDPNYKFPVSVLTGPRSNSSQKKLNDKKSAMQNFFSDVVDLPEIPTTSKPKATAKRKSKPIVVNNSSSSVPPKKTKRVDDFIQDDDCTESDTDYQPSAEDIGKSSSEESNEEFPSHGDEQDHVDEIDRKETLLLLENEQIVSKKASLIGQKKPRVAHRSTTNHKPVATILPKDGSRLTIPSSSAIIQRLQVVTVNRSGSNNVPQIKTQSNSQSTNKDISTLHPGAKVRVQHTIPSQLLKASREVKSRSPERNAFSALSSTNDLIPRESRHCKVPSSLRFKYTKDLYKTVVGKCQLEPSLAITIVLERELEAAESAKTSHLYSSAIARLQMRLLREFSPTGLTDDKKPSKAKVSHAQVVGSDQSTVKPQTTVAEVELTTAQLHEGLKKYLMTVEQRKQNGYPVSTSTQRHRVTIENNRNVNVKQDLGSHERKCLRCSKIFLVDPSNSRQKVSDDSCCFHWGRLVAITGPGRTKGERAYSCCDAPFKSNGCHVLPRHVHQQNLIDRRDGFAMADATPPDVKRHQLVLAMDCEMVYTSFGVEIGRVTATGPFDARVLDIKVRTDGQLLDTNQRFSGLRDSDIRNAEYTQESARRALLDIMSRDTILVGHSLENDLIGLRIVHDKVVDTAIVFPHRQGPPLKKALRTLALEELGLIIQADIEGHDSLEDCITCMKLMRFKVKNDVLAKRNSERKKTMSTSKAMSSSKP